MPIAIPTSVLGYTSDSRLNYKFLEVSKFLWETHTLNFFSPPEPFHPNERIYWVPTLTESEVSTKPCWL